MTIFQASIAFLGATKHHYNWLCPSVGRSVTHSFDDPHVAPFGLLGLVTLPFLKSKKGELVKVVARSRSSDN